MPESDLDSWDFSLSHDNDYSGSPNAKFMSECLPTGRTRGQSLGGSSHSVPVFGQRSRPGTVLVQ